MRIVELYLTDKAGAPMRPAQSIELHVGLGVVGDRYALQTGQFSHLEGPRRQVTLISRESLDRLASEFGFRLAPGQHRRNVVVAGADLPSLIGRSFRLGPCVLEGVDHAHPCEYLESITMPGLLKAMAVTGGGLRALVSEGGIVRIGDELVPGGDARSADCTDDCAIP